MSVLSRLIREYNYNDEFVDCGPMTISASNTSPTLGTVTHNRIWMKKGKHTATIKFELEQTGGTDGSGYYLFDLPKGIEADLSKIARQPTTASTRGQVLGPCMCTNTTSLVAATAVNGTVHLKTSRSFELLIRIAGGQLTLLGNASLGMSGNLYAYGIFELPIKG